jgi:hypothetical protein
MPIRLLLLLGLILAGCSQGATVVPKATKAPPPPPLIGQGGGSDGGGGMGGGM